MIPYVLLVFAVAYLIYSFTSRSDAYGLEIPVGFLGIAELTLPVWLLFLIVGLARPLMLMRDSCHYMSDHHLRSTTGMMSLRREQVNIPFEDILGVRVSQGILERIFNTGTILVWTAFADRPEVKMKGIFRPQHYADMLSARIDDALVNRGQMRKAKH